MVASPQELVSELRAIPEYVSLFEEAFGNEDAVTYENVQNSIAAFERSLVTNNAPFDRYAAGDITALTAAQRRGLGIFRSAGTRCFECHSAPTFFGQFIFCHRCTDLPGQVHDTGRLQVESTSLDGAFRAPTLRNIALTAPYMHNGAFATLEEVVDFYAKGGGRDDGIENIDMHVIGFELIEQEKADLVAFMYALTDESNLPEFPESVPSGLPIVEHVENPAREVVSQVNAIGTEAGTTSRMKRLRCESKKARRSNLWSIRHCPAIPSKYPTVSTRNMSSSMSATSNSSAFPMRQANGRSSKAKAAGQMA